MSRQKSILISFPFSDHHGAWSIPLGSACVSAFQALGYRVETFNTADATHGGLDWKKLERLTTFAGRLVGKSADWAKSRAPWLADYHLCKKFLAAIERSQPDILLVISGATYPEWLLAHARENLGVKHTIGWCIEGPTWAVSINAQAPLYDNYFCIHQNGFAHPNMAFLPAVGVDTSAYSRLSGEQKTGGLVFVGRQKKRRIAWLEPLKSLGLTVHGPAWEQTTLAPVTTSSGIFGAELNEVYNRSKIVLNVSAWDNEKLDCLNLRILDVPATGSLLLTDYAPGIEEYLVPDQEVVIAHSPEEMYDKARYYLTHDAARERIAQAGWAKVQTLETYPQKMQGLLTICGISNPEKAWPKSRTRRTSSGGLPAEVHSTWLHSTTG